MKLNLLLKGILITAIAFLAQTISTNGLPSTSIAWQVEGFTLLGTIIIYVSQSLIIPTSSNQLGINWQDLVKGLLVSLGNFLSGVGASYVVNAAIDYKAMATAAVMLLITYLAKQFITKPAENAS